MKLWSPSFEHGEYMPDRLTCDGKDVSPELHWDHIPDETLSLALILHDPDVPGDDYAHWIIFDISPDLDAIEEGAGPNTAGISGLNVAGVLGYDGPCPPLGAPKHHYHFVLYALDVESLELPEGATRAQVENAMRGRVIEQTDLVGLYARM